MLEVRELRVERGRNEVVHGVDLSVDRGEAVGMIGPNGAGKTSVLRAICGLLRPSSGEVRLEGRPLCGLAPEKIARLGVALVPEGRQIFGTLSVAENLLVATRNGSHDGIEKVLRSFPLLRERAKQRADSLSGGEQQQLAIARALVCSPRLLVLDEPSFGLAPKWIDRIYDLLASLHREGVAILLVEQNVKRTIDFCDRSLVLAGGLVKVRGSRDGLQRDPDVLRAYLGRQL